MPGNMQVIEMMKICSIALMIMMTAPAAAEEASDPTEHFLTGEFRGSLSWDNISAMETGVLKFGGSAGIHILNGIEIGAEQQFIVDPMARSVGRSWGYIRAVPFRNWPVNPFVAARLGYYFQPDRDAVALGAGFGAVMFVDHYLAFEASLFTQAVFHPAGSSERQTEFDWRVVLFF